MSEELKSVVAELRALVAAQSEQIDRLQHRMVELEGRGGERSAASTSSAPAGDTRVSRRNLFGKAGAVAAGVAGAAVAGGVLAQPAAAATGDPLLAGFRTDANDSTYLRLYNYEDDFGFAVFDKGGFKPNPAYIAAYSRKRASGKNMPAFRGESEASYAFYGTSTNVPAVFGTSTGSAGVQGNCTGSGPAGVIGASTSSDGVYGLANNGNGVLGQSTGGNGVNGTSSSGNGVHGKSGGSFGVFGESNSGVGVKGQSNYNPGVQAISTLTAALEAHGATYGASLQGDAAALFLVPQTAAGKPTSGKHRRGELLCDKNGLLWFCTAAGTPGTWKKVSLV